MRRLVWRGEIDDFIRRDIYTSWTDLTSLLVRGRCVKKHVQIYKTLDNREEIQFSWEEIAKNRRIYSQVREVEWTIKTLNLVHKDYMRDTQEV